jgi:hypothetical protein
MCIAQLWFFQWFLFFKVELGLTFRKLPSLPRLFLSSAFRPEEVKGVWGGA